MEEHENLYEKIREILGGQPGRMKVLEQQIDMDLQVEYYESSSKLRKELDDQWALDQIPYLSEPGYTEDVKKEILARLATVERVESYRAIEKFCREGEESLRDWARMALNESRMHLETSIMEENQVFISTGLGGKGEKLRYFMVLISRCNIPLSPTQRKVIRNEFDAALKKYDAEVEELRFSEYLATIMLLLPMHHSMKSVFQEAIDECNQFGNFLMDDFIVTNVRKLSFKEIKEFLDRSDGKKGEGYGVQA